MCPYGFAAGYNFYGDIETHRVNPIKRRTERICVEIGPSIETLHVFGGETPKGCVVVSGEATATETMTAVLREDPNILDLVPNVPLGLQRIVQRCLEKGPGQRFHSAADLVFWRPKASQTSHYKRFSLLIRRKNR